MSNRVLMINLGDIEKEDATVDEVNALILGHIGKELEQSLGVSIGIFDSVKSDAQKLVTACEEVGRPTDHFAVIKCEVLTLNELKELISQNIPQHEHNKEAD